MKFKILVLKLLLAVLSEVSGLRAGSIGNRHSDLKEEVEQALKVYLEDEEPKDAG